MLVLSERPISIQEYIEKYGHHTAEVGITDLGELRDWLDSNNMGAIWDRPLSEISEVVENDIPVVLVHDNQHTEYRWFEV